MQIYAGPRDKKLRFGARACWPLLRPGAVGPRDNGPNCPHPHTYDPPPSLGRQSHPLGGATITLINRVVNKRVEGKFVENLLRGGGHITIRMVGTLRAIRQFIKQ